MPTVCWEVSPPIYLWFRLTRSELLKYHSIRHLSFFIGLWVAHGYEPVINMQLDAEFSECLVVKLLVIIHDEDMRQLELTDGLLE